MIGPDDDTHVGAMPSGSSRPARLVLGVGLLLIGIGNLLAIDLVLLPRTLGGARAVAPSPAPASVPVATPRVPLATVATPSPASVPAAAAVAAPVAATPPVEPIRPQTDPTPLPPLLFPQNTAWLSPSARQMLAGLAARMKENPGLRVELGGHTDDLGPERINRPLSLRRAQRVGERLQALGIDASRIEVQGFGSTQPTDQSRTTGGRARNRRVEIALH